LDVHYLRDVVWNTEAFDSLVVQEETKVLIRAVVTNQLRTTENADLIHGKGNGLFILLHGYNSIIHELLDRHLTIGQRTRYRQDFDCRKVCTPLCEE
jgi:hypothetical protein